MSKTLIFSSSIGNIVKEKGGIKKDEDGYFFVRFGTIGVANSSGIVYEVTEGVKKLFHKNSPVMTRLLNGYLRSEQGHPKRLPGMSEKDFVRRILKIEETRFCGHIREVVIKEDLDGPGTFTVFAWIKPYGPYGESLKDDLENPHSNTAFSIRSLVDQRIENGMIIRTLKTIVTWDFVDSPGIENANKVNSIGIEECDLLEIDTSNTVAVESLIEDLTDYSNDIGNEDDKEIVNSVINELSICGTGKCIYRDWH